MLPIEELAKTTMRVHLFFRPPYGLAYARAASYEGRALGIEIVGVLSERRRSLFARSRRAWKRRTLARELGFPLTGTADVNSPAFLSKIRPGDHGVIAGFNQIFSAEAIARFTTFVNFHPSLLPYYRGPVPSVWCLRNGEASSGFTLHRVAARVDAGEVLDQGVVAIDGVSSSDELDERISVAGAESLRRWLRHLASGERWQARVVDAGSVYREHPGYLSFPAD
jgi:methionyl-tRNA formyltransferase